MAKDAYQLQGGNGGVALGSGQTFQALNSKGHASFVVFDLDTEIVGYEGNIVNGDTVYAGATRVAGQTMGGSTSALSIGAGGGATLYGVGAAENYTIT